MRDIKFRGKRVDNVEWIEGYYLIDEQHDIPRHCIWAREFCGTGIANDIVQVDPKTVGQYTGLKDKNGKDIYEGDIFVPRYNRFSPMVVTYEEGKYNIAEFNLKRTEVIGNKWENPDLLG